jgi:hypothetical protein
MTQQMADFTMHAKSERSTFTVHFKAQNDDDMLKEAGRLAMKARLPIDANVSIVRTDGTVTDVSEALRPYFEAGS